MFKKTRYDQPPLVKGGQGRSSKSIIWDAWAVVVLALSLTAATLLVLFCLYVFNMPS